MRLTTAVLTGKVRPMSRSRQQFDKARRDERQKKSGSSLDFAPAPTDRIPEGLQKQQLSEKLKPILLKHLFARSQNHKHFSEDFLQCLREIILHASVSIVAREPAADSNIRCEVVLDCSCKRGAYIESEQFQFILDTLAETHDLVGNRWLLYFWLSFPESTVTPT